MAQKNIVYILGAGFSAPHRLPVVANFMDVADEIYWNLEPGNERDVMEKVFKLKRGLSTAHEYVNTDLRNVEELLSIAEMQLRFQPNGQNDTGALLREFIRIVIEKRTRAPESTREQCRTRDVFNPSRSGWLLAFVAHLHGLMVYEGSDEFAWTLQVGPQREENYTVITFNYDRLFELATTSLEGRLGHLITPEPPGSNSSQGCCALIKLHGCVGDTKSIVPPTSEKSVQGTWSQAYDALVKANAIRFLGYSLPAGDEYFRCFLKAVFADERSKQFVCIDALTLDPDSTARGRFDAFLRLRPPRFIFRHDSVDRYLDSTVASRRSLGAGKSDWGNFEKLHGDFFGRDSLK